MEVSKPVSNYLVHGKPVSFARIKGVDEDQGIVICDLLDENNQVLAAGRYFSINKDSPKAAPFELECPTENAAPGVPASEEDVGSGRPDGDSTIAQIQEWLTARKITYRKSASKAELLDLVKDHNGQEAG